MAIIYSPDGIAIGNDDINGDVRQAKSISGLDTNKAPPKASAAPSGNTPYNFQGLCAALNAWEKDLVKNKTVELANEYEIIFLPPDMASATVTVPGATSLAQTVSPVNRTAAAVVNPDTNSVNTQALTKSITAGTQIVQFIEMVIRNSSYITDQQKYYNDSVYPGTVITNTTATNGTPTSWFKINMTVVPIGKTIDKIRNDFPYRITYLITPYAINQARSQYFPDARFLGANKVYNYWFTGLNTQVLNFEQKFDTLYNNIITAGVPAPVFSQPDHPMAIAAIQKNSPAPATGQSDKGLPNSALNGPSSLADYLYSPSDQAKISIKIVGDPAWIVQGEILGLSAQNFVFQGFYPDGTVNSDAQAPTFVLNWNAPSDYDNGTSGPHSGTGLMNINGGETGNNNNNLATTPPRQSAAYSVTTIKSTFSKGRFEQELVDATLILNVNQDQINSIIGKPTTDRIKPVEPPMNVRTGSTQLNNTTNTTMVNNASPAVTVPNANTIPSTTTAPSLPISNPPNQGANAPGAPTSDGVVVGAAYAPNSPPDAGRVTVYGPAGATATTITPSAESLALGAGRVVVYGAGGSTISNPNALTNSNSNVAVTVNNVQQTMTAKDA